MVVFREPKKGTHHHCPRFPPNHHHHHDRDHRHDEKSGIHGGMTGGAREFEAMPTPVHTATLYNNLLIRMFIIIMNIMIIVMIITILIITITITMINIKITIIVETPVYTAALYDTNLLIRRLMMMIFIKSTQSQPETRCSSRKRDVSF